MNKLKFDDVMGIFLMGWLALCILVLSWVIGEPWGYVSLIYLSAYFLKEFSPIEEVNTKEGYAKRILCFFPQPVWTSSTEYYWTWPFSVLWECHYYLMDGCGGSPASYFKTERPTELL